MEEILIKNNLPHVITLKKSDDFEDLFEMNYEDVNVHDLILGMSELNKNGICLLNISVSKSREGITKIDKNAIHNAGLYKGGAWLKEPEIVDFLPEGENIIPFKSDSWALGEFIVKVITGGKTIPKRFMKSQTLMNKFIDSLPENHKDILQKILILDPDQREYTWNLIKENEGCTIQ